MKDPEKDYREVLERIGSIKEVFVCCYSFSSRDHERVTAEKGISRQERCEGSAKGAYVILV